MSRIGRWSGKLSGSEQRDQTVKVVESGCLNTVMVTGVMNWNLGEADRMGGAERSGVDSVTVVSKTQLFSLPSKLQCHWMNQGMLNLTVPE